MKIIFMGTPQFAVPILEKIASEHEVVLVVTQPDQYNYKKKTVLFNPVKEWAVNHNIEVFQPEKIKLEKEYILNIPCELIVTAAYGQIVPVEILNHPRLKCINVHGSLLPKYRGGAPIQRSIINGDDKTGITIMYMDVKMDAGDILVQKELIIEESDNQDTVFNKLSLLGSEMINDAIDQLDKGLLTPIKQNEEEVTYAFNLNKQDELIDFSKDARSVFNQIRGLNSNPGAYFVLDNMNIKVYDSKVSSEKTSLECGKIVSINKKYFDISCKDGSVISILQLQIPGKQKMSSCDFINGQGRKLLEIGKVVNNG